MKYRNFYVIGRIIAILAWVLGIIYFALNVLSAVTAEPVEGASPLAVPLTIFVAFVISALIIIFLYAFSRLIYVSIDIERNTRQTLRAVLEEIEEEEGEEEEAETEEGE